ncbi:MAG TPA: RNA methyltransferase [Acidobacteriaceae bacterium]|jgi:TrmH family RNA methyltransferase|nr:RNA methyltransferase [Acidobacteriaceae bacterium]
MPQRSISQLAPQSVGGSASVIRSRHNARVKELRQRLLHPAREADGKIAVEGMHLVQEALRSGLQIDTLFVREDTAERLAQLPANETLVLEKDIFNQACATEAPQGVAAFVQKPTALLRQILQRENPLLILLEGMQDPGNLGTILRSAEAFGASGVVLLAGTVSPWNQKAMRASAGSVFRVPVISVAHADVLTQLREHGMAIYAAVARDGTDVAQTLLHGPVALLIGNEGAGLSAELLQQADGRIQIPCPGPVESLNAGIAASILLYAAARQRSATAEKRTSAKEQAASNKKQGGRA